MDLSGNIIIGHNLIKYCSCISIFIFELELTINLQSAVKLMCA